MAYRLGRHLTSTRLASRSIAEARGSSRSLSELLGAFRSLSEPDSNGGLSELLGTIRNPLGASYLSSGLPFGKSPEKYLPCLFHFWLDVLTTDKTHRRVQPGRAKRGSPPLAERSEALPQSLARALNESWDATRLEANKHGGNQLPASAGKRALHIRDS